MRASLLQRQQQVLGRGRAELLPAAGRGGRVPRLAQQQQPSPRLPMVVVARAGDGNGGSDADEAAAERRRQERLQARQARQAEAAAAAAASAPPAAAAAAAEDGDGRAATTAAGQAAGSAASRRSGGGRLRRAAAVAARRRPGGGGGSSGGSSSGSALLAARLDVPDDDDDEEEEEEDDKPAPTKQQAKRAEASSKRQGAKAGKKPTKPAAASDQQQQQQQRGQQQQQGQQQQTREQRQQQRPTPVFLDEASPFYQPALTDDELGNDPPGHRSGYVAVIGRPNAGKSTLINALVGQKLCAVSPRPQTTRHRVVGLACGPDHQMVLFDTPGIVREQRSRLEERMMAAVVSSIRSAEAIVAVVDAADDPREALAMFQPGPDWDGPPMAVLLNKADALLALPPRSGEGGGEGEAEDAPRAPRPRPGEGGGGWGEEAPPTAEAAAAAPPPPPEDSPQVQAQRARLAELEAWYRDNCRAEAVFVGSARAGAADSGVAAVRAWAVSRLPEGPTLYPKAMVSEQPERFFVSEIIRERIFELYGQEIPYAAQVQVEEFRERAAAGAGGGAGGAEGGRRREQGRAAAAAAAGAAAGEQGQEEDEQPDSDAEEAPSTQATTTPAAAVVKDFIRAAILLERESQVAIVVGTGGKKLRRLGAEARREIEGFLGRPVYLELEVRVAPGWRESPERLREFGYYSDLYI